MTLTAVLFLFSIRNLMSSVFVVSCVYNILKYEESCHFGRKPSEVKRLIGHRLICSAACGCLLHIIREEIVQIGLMRGCITNSGSLQLESGSEPSACCKLDDRGKYLTGKGRKYQNYTDRDEPNRRRKRSNPEV
jgi:hypothetical protein